MKRLLLYIGVTHSIKKTHTLILFLFFALGTASAQEVLSSQGDSYSNTNGNIDFTIGEVITSTETDGTNTITQGFHQSTWTFVKVIVHEPTYEAIIFPNPTEDVLNIRTNSFENVSYALLDAQGKLVLQGSLSDVITPVRVHHLASGAYFITLNNQEHKLKTFKLIKSD